MIENLSVLSEFNYSAYTNSFTRVGVPDSENIQQPGEIRSEALGPKECKT